MKTIGISIIFIMAVFVFSCTPKDRTARINEIYEELEKEVADETKDESKTPDENLEPDDEQVEEDVEIIDESDEDAVDDSDVFKVSGAICTGQTKCYNETAEIPCPKEGEDFYGQDAQYLDKCVPRSYSISGTSPEEIVTDNNTGLEWQRTISENTFTWQEAIDYCDGLSYGGYDDWRSPTRKEISSLVDNGKSDPAIDTNKFSYTPAARFWSSSFVYGGTTHAWCVSFSFGHVDIENLLTTYFVRCVRGSALSSNSFVESTVSGKVIVADATTGLVWQKEYNSSTTWANALSYCETSTYAGYSDWRLPNIEEVETLVDFTAYNPASNFPEMVPNYLWSSSSYDKNGAWIVDFYSGSLTASGDKESILNAICVRNGE